MADYRLSTEDEQDLRGIFRYTFEHYGVEQARAYQTSLIQSAEMIANFPAIGRTYVVDDGREFQRYNIGEHAIFYQKVDGSVRIVRILHQKMDMDQQFGQYD